MGGVLARSSMGLGPTNTKLTNKAESLTIKLEKIGRQYFDISLRSSVMVEIL